MPIQNKLPCVMRKSIKKLFPNAPNLISCWRWLGKYVLANSRVKPIRKKPLVTCANFRRWYRLILNITLSLNLTFLF